MDLSADATWWWIVSGVLIAVELSTGTFYLLMLAAGTVAAALAAHWGLGPSAQMITAAIVGGGAVVIWHVWRGSRVKEVPTQANRDVNLDIGAQVQVDHWNADGSTRVTYRGASWAARFQGDGVPIPGYYVISALNGSELMLERRS